MIRAKKAKPMLFQLASRTPPSIPGGRFADMSRRVGATVPAAWPTGLAQLGAAVTKCETCEAVEVCQDWLARAPAHIDTVPPFCPNAAELLRATKKTG